MEFNNFLPPPYHPQVNLPTITLIEGNQNARPVILQAFHAATPETRILEVRREDLIRRYGHQILELIYGNFETPNFAITDINQLNIQNVPLENENRDMLLRIAGEFLTEFQSLQSLSRDRDIRLEWINLFGRTNLLTANNFTDDQESFVERFLGHYYSISTEIRFSSNVENLRNFAGYILNSSIILPRRFSRLGALAIRLGYNQAFFNAFLNNNNAQEYFRNNTHTAREHFAIAINYGRLQVIEALAGIYDYGVDINTQFIKFQNPHYILPRHTPLILASERGFLEIVRYLLRLPTIDLTTNNQGNRAFMVAATHGHANVVEHYLTNVPAIDFNAIDENYLTAFMRAAENGHLGVVQAILRNRAVDINATPTHRRMEMHGREILGLTDTRTALDLAARNGHTNVVEYLLNSFENNIDANVIERAFYATILGDHARTVEIFLRFGGGSNTVRIATALKYAASEGRVAVTRILLNALGININVEIIEDARRAAAQKGHNAVIQILLEAQARLEE